MKTCRHCQVEKSEASFGNAPRNRDGLKSYCRPCENLRIAENRRKPVIRERRRAYDRQRNALPDVRASAMARRTTLEYRAMQSASTAAYKLSNPEAASAHRAVHNALRRGALRREPCHECGKKAEAHHPDYSAPLSVVWLCRQHHVEAHAVTRQGE